MGKIFEVRTFNSEDIEGITQLLSQAFPEWARRKDPADYLHWKYLSTPLKSDIAVAVDQGEVIGVTFRLNFEVKVGDTILHATYGDDAATHTDYRGIGVHGSLEKFIVNLESADPPQLYLEIPINQMLLKNYLEKNRPMFPHKLSHMYRVKDPGLHFQKKDVRHKILLGAGFKAAKVARRIRVQRGEAGSVEHDFHLETIDVFDESLDRFWEKANGGYGFALKKNSRYLNWRYGDRRGGEYSIRVAKAGDDVLGFIVTRSTFDSDYEEGYITDLMTLPDRADVSDSLVGDACQSFDSRKVNAVHYLTVKENRFYRSALKWGFVESPFSNVNLFNDFVDEGKRLALANMSPEMVQFSFGDYL